MALTKLTVIPQFHLIISVYANFLDLPSDLRDLHKHHSQMPLGCREGTGTRDMEGWKLLQVGIPKELETPCHFHLS